LASNLSCIPDILTYRRPLEARLQLTCSQQDAESQLRCVLPSRRVDFS
jgi:hypothetical protein